VRLAKLPLGSGPVVISRFWIDKPVLTFGPDTFKKMTKPSGREQAPRKLSEMLRLRELHLSGGRVTYRNGTQSEDGPMVWDRLDLDAELQQQSPSKYNLHLSSKAAASADASATGTIDVDELLLEIDNLVFKGHAEPEPQRTPLPANVQKFLKRYRMTGSMSLSGNGTVPLRDPANAACQIKLTLDDGSALIPPEPAMLDHARASLAVKKSRGGPVQIKIEQIDVAGGGKNVLIDGGAATLDTEGGTWKLEGISGHVQVEPPDLPTSGPIAPAPAPLVSATRPRAPRGNPIDKFEPEGASISRPPPPGRSTCTGKARGRRSSTKSSRTRAVSH
jgi:hypothetical protein